jgi:tRNA(fMet)-specific endonuclease VapC
MILLLDTNVCIDLLRKSQTPVSAAFLDAIVRGDDLAISSISVFELEFGLIRAGNKPKDVAAITDLLQGPVRIVNFDHAASKAAASLSANTISKGSQLSAYDGLIAGHAIALGATLVTADAKLAEALVDVEVVDWRK